MLPLGVVLSVMSTQVTVGGMEEHSPLAEESEVPEGVSEGTPVSFVADYAQHILNTKELQKKGYDASGDNDEEVAEELEFSDDEKEAQYRKTQKVEKRGMMDDQNDKNRGSSSLPSNRSDPQMGGPVTNHQPRPRMEGFPPNGGGWRPHNNQQNSHQFPPMPSQMAIPNLPPMQNQMMFRPQFNGGQLRMPAGPGGLNVLQGQATAPWPALVGQNCFNQQPFGMGRGIQAPQLLNELIFNLLASQGLQMLRPQSPMNPQCPMNPQFQILNRPQAPVNPQFPMQPQFPMNPQFQMRNNNRPQSPMNPYFQMQPQFQMLNNNRSQSPMNPRCQMQPQSQGWKGAPWSWQR
ncbi:hypothetical protein F2Q70_00037937 [Brassica cretica]|nr:hypothetical protein F2Q70_00037937 [Brassica cretica]